MLADSLPVLAGAVGCIAGMAFGWWVKEGAARRDRDLAEQVRRDRDAHHEMRVVDLCGRLHNAEKQRDSALDAVASIRDLTDSSDLEGVRAHAEQALSDQGYTGRLRAVQAALEAVTDDLDKHRRVCWLDGDAPHVIWHAGETAPIPAVTDQPGSRPAAASGTAGDDGDGLLVDGAGWWAR
ncbi:hypothetical protein [Microtetraspora malaysiensis]|uniref:Uncharacterized protein n=1 Tax=Microtetraspora malaysiensis TaxID=161358 RepID=A0ABW6SKH4_9ACTN